MVEGLPRAPDQRPTLIAIRYKLILDDVVSLFEAHGFQVELWEPSDITVARFEARVVSDPPWGVFAINYSPELAFLTSVFGIPYISWTIDPLPSHRMRLRPGTRPELSLAFVHRESTQSCLENLGLMDVRRLPLAAPLRRRERVCDPALLRDYEAPVTFVGNSLRMDASTLTLSLQRLGTGQEVISAIRARLQALFERFGEVPSYQGESTLEQVLGDSLPDLDPESLEGLRLLDSINGFISERLRFTRVEALGSLGIQVWGDAGWRRTSTHYRGLADHGDELTRIYCASQINLDIPRIYQRDILTMRVFDVLACGGILLTEASETLREHFVPGEHLYTYEDSADMVARAQLILDNPEQAREVAQAGEIHVRTHHSMEHRFRSIVTACAERGWLLT